MDKTFFKNTKVRFLYFKVKMTILIISIKKIFLTCGCTLIYKINSRHNFIEDYSATSKMVLKRGPLQGDRWVRRAYKAKVKTFGHEFDSRYLHHGLIAQLVRAFA